MGIITVTDYAALSQRAADIIADQIRHKPDTVLVVPTGNTPLGMFRALAQQVANKMVDFSSVRLVQLDEYYGIARDDPRNLYVWMEREFIAPAGIRAEHIIRFDSAAPDPQSELQRVADCIAALGGLDLIVLGLGPNGHLGFNEPGSPFDQTMQHVILTPASIRSNAAYWGGEAHVPREGLTLGMGTLGSARRALLLVSGGHKAEILARAVHGPITPDVPATLLRALPDAIILADEAAATAL